MQLCGQPCRSTTSAPTLSESVIKHLYDKATSAVLSNGSIGDWFRTTVGVRQRCLLSPTVFNIFPERIVTGALENHKSTVSIGGSNFRFADDIDGLAGEEEELAKVMERLDKASTAYSTVSELVGVLSPVNH